MQPHASSSYTVVTVMLMAPAGAFAPATTRMLCCVMLCYYIAIFSGLDATHARARDARADVFTKVSHSSVFVWEP